MSNYVTELGGTTPTAAKPSTQVSITREAAQAARTSAVRSRSTKTILIALGVAAVGGGAWWFMKKRKKAVTP
jgi:LPXTG-motif cell wall-anchored protein